jgi:hypothetical protein
MGGLHRHAFYSLEMISWQRNTYFLNILRYSEKGFLIYLEKGYILNEIFGL